jgi:hypothetical protein
MTPVASPEEDYINRRGAEVLREMTRNETPIDRLEDEGYKFLNERYATMEEAGLPNSMAAKMDGVGSLPSNSRFPQEVRESVRPGIESRYHTNYTDEVNPITGQVDVVPYLDPVTGRGMVTNLGEGVTRQEMDGYQKASEYVQQQIGRLAGSQVVANHGANKYAPDFTTTSGSLIFDGETTRPSWRRAGDAIQAYTKVVDSRNPNQHANRMAPEIKRVLEGIIAKNPNAGIEEIMSIAGNRLDGGTYSGRRQPPIKGKAFDTDKDAVMLTVLSDKDHEYNKVHRDTMPVPVQGVMWQNMNALREVMPTITGRELSSGLQVRPNYGNNRDGEARGRISITPGRRKAQQITNDLRVTEPRIEQLFDYKQ